MLSKTVRRLIEPKLAWRRTNRLMTKPTNVEQVLESDASTPDLGLPLIPRISIVRNYSASKISWHSHSFCEILLLSEGATIYEFQGGLTASLTGGQFLVIPPNCVHRGLNELRSPGALCGMMVSTRLPEALTHSPFSHQEITWLESCLQTSSLRPHKMSRELRAQVRALPHDIRTFCGQSIPSVLRTRLKACQILLEVASAIEKPSTVASETLVERAIQYMHEHLEEPVAIAKIADWVGCSRARLFEVFREVSGQTPNDYWQRLRVEEAYRRLTTSNESVTKIALDCGFTTSQYFCTVFRKYWGISPRDCRSDHLRQSVRAN